MTILMLLLLSVLAGQQAPITAVVRVDDSSPLPLADKLPGQPPLRLRVTGGPGGFAPPPSYNRQGRKEYVLNLSAGSYTVTADALPIGYYLKSMTAGTVDLTRAPLVVPTNPGNMQVEIVLTKNRPAGMTPGVKVSGRLPDQELPLSSNLTLVLMHLVSPNRPATRHPVAYFEVDRKVGSFEFLDVPPGHYVLGDLRKFPNFMQSFDVTGTDVDLVLRLRR